MLALGRDVDRILLDERRRVRCASLDVRGIKSKDCLSIRVISRTSNNCDVMSLILVLSINKSILCAEDMKDIKLILNPRQPAKGAIKKADNKNARMDGLTAFMA